MDDNWVKIQTKEEGAFTEHGYLVNINIRFTKKDMTDNKLPLLNCVVDTEEDRSLKTDTYTHKNMLFDPHNPLEHNLAVRTVHKWAKNFSIRAQREENEYRHAKKALQTCVYPN